MKLPTLAKAKKWTRVLNEEEDEILEDLIVSGVSYAESVCKCFLYPVTASRETKEYCLKIDGAEIEVLSVEFSETGLDADYEPLVEGTDYVLTESAMAKTVTYAGDLWERGVSKLRVTAKLGYTDPPKQLDTAVLMIVSKLFNVRDEQVKALPSTVDAYLVPFKIYTVA